MMASILIHATNINGIGAIQVVNSLLPPLIRHLKNNSIYCFLPVNFKNAKDLQFRKNVQINFFKRYIPNSLSRLMELFFAPLLFPDTQSAIVLGDIPLRGIKIR